jgi:hypothetical protein
MLRGTFPSMAIHVALPNALFDKRKETEGQVHRLDQVFRLLVRC